MFRQGLGWDQKDLAEAATRSTATISRVEKGHDSGISVYADLARALGVPLAELVNLEASIPFPRAVPMLRGRDSNPQPSGYQLQPKVA